MVEDLSYYGYISKKHKVSYIIYTSKGLVTCIEHVKSKDILEILTYLLSDSRVYSIISIEQITCDCWIP